MAAVGAACQSYTTKYTNFCCGGFNIYKREENAETHQIMTLGNWNVPTWLLCNTKKLNTEILYWVPPILKHTKKGRSTAYLYTIRLKHIYIEQVSFLYFFMKILYFKANIFLFYPSIKTLSFESSIIEIFWPIELNDLWSKTIFRPKMIVRSGATFIPRWSCLSVCF